MDIRDYPVTAISLVICLSLLSGEGLLAVMNLLKKYQKTYLDSVGMGLRDLFLLFSPEEVLGVGAGIACGVGLLSYVLFRSVIIAAICFLAGFWSPRYFLSRARKKRLESLGLQLVDGLALVSNALRAGQSLPQAFGLLISEMPPPISQEFGILWKEYDLGVPMDTCLANLANRVPIEDVQLFVNSILICGQTGGNLTETFDNIAAMIRERVRLQGKIESMTSEGRAQGLVLTLMPLFLGLAFYWVDPQLMRPLFTTTVGLILLFFIVALDVLAWFLTKKIIDIDI